MVFSDAAVTLFSSRQISLSGGLTALVGAGVTSDDRLMTSVLAYLAASITALWVLPRGTDGVSLGGFEPITTDNRRVVLQEWLAEAFTMWGVAALVVAVTAVAGGSDASKATDGAAAGLLVALAVLTSLTGARTSVIWFKICPVLLSLSALLLVVAALA